MLAIERPAHAANEALRTRLRWLMSEAPRGAVEPVPGSAEHFWVKGTETVYLVDAGSYKRRRMPSCECLAGRYRKHCAHMDAVRAYLEEWRLCPICHGTAYWRPNGSIVYADPVRGGRDRTAIPLVCCMGGGTREAWEREGCFVPREAA